MAVLPLLKALVEPVRIRLYLLVKKSPLTVSEISEILEVSQSNASHHVKALKDLNLFSAEKIGQHTFYGLTPQAVESRISEMLENLSRLADEIPETKSDAIKLNAIIAARRGDTFTQWRMEQPDLPYSDIFAHLASGKRGTVVDIGCGEGDFFERLSTSFLHVIGIDLEARHLLRAVGRLTSAENIVINADATALPLADSSSDAVIMRMALAQIPDMTSALLEAIRIVRATGYVSIIDLEKKGTVDLRKMVNKFVADHGAVRLDFERPLPRLLMVRLQKLS